MPKVLVISGACQRRSITATILFENHGKVFIDSVQTSACNSSHIVCQIMWLIEERCAMTFISDRAYGDCSVAEKLAEKSHRLASCWQAV